MQSNINTRTRFVLAALLLAWSAVARPGECLGQVGGDEAEIERLSNLALELARGGRLEDAVQVWRALSGRVETSSLPDVELNLGLAYRKLGRLEPAWHYLRRFVAARPEETRVAKELAAVEALLTQTHARVQFQCESPMVALRFEDGFEASIWPCPLEWWLEPGEHRVAAEVGDVVVVLPVRVSAQRTDLRILVPAITVPVEAVTRPLQVGGEQAAVSVAYGNSVSGGAWALLLVGAASLLAGGACHGWAWWDERNLRQVYPDKGVPYATFLENRAAYNRAYDDDIAPFVISSYVLYGVGAASLLGGVAWLLFGDASLEPSPSVSFLPEGGLMIGIGW